MEIYSDDEDSWILEKAVSEETQKLIKINQK